MNEQEIDPQVTETPQDITPEPKLNRQQILFSILGVVILITAGFLYTQYFPRTTVISTDYGYQQVPQDLNQQLSAIPEGSYFIPPVVDFSNPPKANTTVQWQTPKEIPDRHLVIASTVYPDQDPYEIKYYELGQHSGNKIIVAMAPCQGMCFNPEQIFFEETSKGLMLMVAVSVDDIYRGQSGVDGFYAISNEVKLADTQTVYYGLTGPEKFTWNGFVLNGSNRVQGLFSEYTKSFQNDNNVVLKKVDTIKDGDIFLIQRVSSNEEISTQKFYLRRYILKLPSGFYSQFSVSYDFLTDNSVPKITWKDGSKNSDGYRLEGNLSGCGSPGAYLVPVDDISQDIQITGKTSTNIDIYEFKDIANPTLKYFYDLINGQYFNSTTQQMEKISMQEWYKKHPIVVFKNGLGDYSILTNDIYGAQAECGKPVVYLYPTRTTNVSVKVGADISVSEPSYNNGWNVIAQPNGQLTNSDGQTYNSLFWEGLGQGDYPTITQGFVVARNDVESTITIQLAQLGLNDKESQDFKDFWLSRMPNTPYVRLTWFTTSQMDQLAPLSVNPKPDTVIRVFLDFQGLNKFATIPSQHLTALPRKGFTLVEWGGLLKK